jgi:type I site-specific restriction endonuclease
MTPKQKARKLIDHQLELAGWGVQDFKQVNISAKLGVAVREFQLTSGFADYLLYANCKAIAVIEAKPEGFNLIGVETQSGKYLQGLPKNLLSNGQPLPFALESTGKATRLPNNFKGDAHHGSFLLSMGPGNGSVWSSCRINCVRVCGTLDWPHEFNLGLPF